MHGCTEDTGQRKQYVLLIHVSSVHSRARVAVSTRDPCKGYARRENCSKPVLLQTMAMCCSEGNSPPTSPRARRTFRRQCVAVDKAWCPDVRAGPVCNGVKGHANGIARPMAALVFRQYRKTVFDSWTTHICHLLAGLAEAMSQFSSAAICRRQYLLDRRHTPVRYTSKNVPSPTSPGARRTSPGYVDASGFPNGPFSDIFKSAENFSSLRTSSAGFSTCVVPSHL